MHIKSFEWNERNVEHIARHGVTPQEVEEACFNQPISRKSRDGLYWIYGQADAGRYLFIVVRLKPSSIVFTITARNMTDKEQRYYRRER